MQPGTGVEVGAGVVVYPPAGWTVVGSQSGQVVLQKAGALMIVMGVPWPGSPAELSSTYSEAFFQAGQFSASEPQSGELGNGIPAVAQAYTGILEGTQVDGAIFAGVSGGAGVVVNVFAASGGLQGIRAATSMPPSPRSRSRETAIDERAAGHLRRGRPAPVGLPDLVLAAPPAGVLALRRHPRRDGVRGPRPAAGDDPGGSRGLVRHPAPPLCPTPSLSSS